MSREHVFLMYFGPLFAHWVSIKWLYTKNNGWIIRHEHCQCEDSIVSVSSKCSSPKKVPVWRPKHTLKLTKLCTRHIWWKCLWFKLIGCGCGQASPLRPPNAGSCDQKPWAFSVTRWLHSTPCKISSLKPRHLHAWLSICICIKTRRRKNFLDPFPQSNRKSAILIHSWDFAANWPYFPASNFNELLQQI